MISDTFNRADQPLHGSVMDSGHTWTVDSGATYAAIATNRVRVTGPSGTWETLAPDRAGATPLTQDNLVSVAVDLASDATGCRFWLQPLITTSFWEVFGAVNQDAVNDDYVFLYYRSPTADTVLGDAAYLPQAITAGGALLTYKMTYDRTTGAASFYQGGTLVLTRNVPSSVRSNLLGDSYSGVSLLTNNAAGPYTLDNFESTGPDVPPPARPPRGPRVFPQKSQQTSARRGPGSYY